MDSARTAYDNLLTRIRLIDPRLIRAIDEVDASLLREFGLLNLRERVDWAATTADSLQRFRKDKCTPSSD